MNAESAYVYARNSDWGLTFTAFGEPTPDAELLEGRAIEDALATVRSKQRNDHRPWDWYFSQQEGPWLADLREQLHLTVADLAELADVSDEAISTFESAPERESLNPFQFVRIVHVLAGLPAPSDREIEAAQDRAMRGSKPMDAAIRVLLALHPDATLPPSPQFGTTPPRKDLMKVVLDEVVPVLKSQGFKRKGLAFLAEPEPFVHQYLDFQMGKGSPPSSWERKGHGPRFIPNYFFVNLGVQYSFEPDSTDEWSSSYAFHIDTPFTRLEAPSELAYCSDQEWSLDEPSATAIGLSRKLSSEVAQWLDARSVEHVLVAMQKPFWFNVLDNRLVACRLACLQGDKELANRLLRWATMDRRDHVKDPGVVRWLADRYGLDN